MESVLKSSVKRVVSFFLSLLLVFQLFPASLITRVAAKQDYSRVPISLAEGEVKDKEAIEKLVSLSLTCLRTGAEVETRILPDGPIFQPDGSRKF